MFYIAEEQEVRISGLLVEKGLVTSQLAEITAARAHLSKQVHILTAILLYVV